MEYKQNYIAYQQIKNFLTFFSKNENRKLEIINISSTFVPDDNIYFSFFGLARPFTSWETGYEAFLVKDIDKVLIDELDSSFVNYKLRVKEKTGYDKHMVGLDEDCSAEPCYKRIKTFQNGTEFLMLETRFDQSTTSLEAVQW